MRTLDPVLTVDLFLPARQALLDLLAELSDAEWSTPTACAGWSVKDLALHLLGGDLANISRRRDGLADALAAYLPAGATLTDRATLVAALNRWNEAWVAAARRISPRLLRDLLAVTGPAIVDYYRGLDPFALGGPVSWAGPEPAPVWLDIAREYTEQWTHQQQIRDAVGRPGLRERRFCGPVLATFVHALPQALRHVAAPEGACLRLIITGEAGGDWLAERQVAGYWRIGHDPAAHADAIATLDADAAWRLFTRGLSRAEAERRVRLAGDQTLAGAVFDMVAIIA